MRKRIPTKHPKTTARIIKTMSQKGGNPRSRSADKARLALPPGIRRSKSGRVYSERRKNRSDTPAERKRHLQATKTTISRGTQARAQTKQAESQKKTVAIQKRTPPHTSKYYSIDEQNARVSKEMSSFSDYKPGSKTREYQSVVDAAAKKVNAHKKRVDPMYHAKIDTAFDTYARKLAELYNEESRIGASVPSVLIAGPSNFPVRKKQKQIERFERNYKKRGELEKYFEKILSIGFGGIRSDDKDAAAKIQKKLQGREEQQEWMKKINAYYRKHGTARGAPGVTEEQAAKIDQSIAEGYGWEKQPFAGYTLKNNYAEIRRLQGRVTELERKKSREYQGWSFAGGEVVMNKEANRLQILFEGKPEESTRAKLKQNGFRWAPSSKAWQRQLTTNAIHAAKRVLNTP